MGSTLDNNAISQNWTHLHCEKESTRVFDFGIEVRTAGIEVRDHSSQNGLVLQYHLFVVIYNFNTKIGSLNHIVGSS